MKHRLKAMVERNPHESRTATTLELLYDLTFVIVFFIAGHSFAHQVTHGLFLQPIVSLLISLTSAILAWISYSWFASIFDTDDWGVRLSVGIQMLGILIMGAGFEDIFSNMESWHFNGILMIAGYTLIRAGLLSLWIRAARANPKRRKICLAHISWIILMGIIWIIYILLNPKGLHILWVILLYGIELIIPSITEVKADLLKWNPEHLTERYGLLTIISIGEIVFSISYLLKSIFENNAIHPTNILSPTLVIICIMGMWWAYFDIPFNEMLKRKPYRIFYYFPLHILLLISIIAIGAGIDIFLEFMNNPQHLNSFIAISYIGVPIFIFLLCLTLLFIFVTRNKINKFLLTIPYLMLILAFVMLKAGIMIYFTPAIIVVTPLVFALCMTKYTSLPD